MIRALHRDRNRRGMLRLCTALHGFYARTGPISRHPQRAVWCYDGEIREAVVPEALQDKRLRGAWP